ncbi:hypothetical protein D3C81_1393280 [compost metagenome]
MAVLEVVDGAKVEQVDLVVVVAAGHALEIADIDVHLLAPGAAGNRQVIGRLPVQLGVGRNAIDPVAGVARRLAGFIQVQAAAFG